MLRAAFFSAWTRGMALIYSQPIRQDATLIRTRHSEEMMKKSAALIGILLLAAGVMFLSACATIEKEEPDAAGTLRVGVSTTYPPIIFRKGKRVAGVEADLARELAGALGKHLVWVELKWERLIPALLEGEIDIIMSGMSVTDARILRIDFSEPYLETGQMALMRHSAAERYNSPERIKASDARIGVQDGTTGDVFVQTQCPRASKVSVAKAEDAMFYFDGNRIDLFIYDAPIIMLMASQHEADVAPLWHLLTSEKLAWGIKKQDKDLLDAANKLLAELKTSGKLDDILSRWIPLSDRLPKNR